ncbi:MAG: YfbU family protein [Pseudomonadota bacterium]
MTPAERLMMLMLCEIYEKTLGKVGDFDPTFIRKSVAGGDLWAIEMEYSGLALDYTVEPDVAREVIDILDMYAFIEETVERLTAAEKASLPAGRDRFRGFDGNNETEHMGAAQLIVEDMGRFPRFKGRGFNAHMPTLAGYRRMLDVFKPIRASLGARAGTPGLTVAELNEILDAKAHPAP